MGAVALCGGDPTVKRTALALAAVPAGNASITPQAPAGATSSGRSVFKLSVLPWCPPKGAFTCCSDNFPVLTDLKKIVM